jgi:hypothetical protein
LKNRRSYAIAAVSVLIIAVAIFVAYNYVSSFHQQDGTSSTNSFYQEPVADVIIPALYNNGINSPLNLTRGSNVSLVVEVFPTINVKAVVGVNILSISSPNENLSNVISASINPTTLSINQGSSANTTMGIAVSLGAQLGDYSVTVTATNSDNKSQSWGTIFQLNILG